MQSFENKTVLITGGSSGIGLATARLFRSRGARVCITGRSSSALAKARSELGSETLALASDAADLKQISELPARVVKEFGTIDVLCANAGVARATPFTATTPEDFDAVMNTNVRGVFFLLQAAIPYMSHKAAIIVTTSIANRKTAPNYGVYGASKAALRSLVQTLAPTLVQSGIRLNAISPGPTDTAMFGRSGLREDLMLERKRELAARSPSRRLGKPDDIARAVMFLASEYATFIVGEEVVVDGAMSLV